MKKYPSSYQLEMKFNIFQLGASKLVNGKIKV